MNKVLVIGSINMDIIISVTKMPEAGENVYCNDLSYACGGKGSNQASALASLGVDTTFLGAVGNDSYGKIVLEDLKSNNVDIKHIKTLGDQTGIAYIMLEEDGSNRIIVAPGANETLTIEHIDEFLIPLLGDIDMVVLQLEISLDCVKRILELCKKYGVKSFVDAGPIRGCKAEDLKDAWCVSPNESELAALFGKEEITEEEEIIEAGKVLIDMGVECVLIKLGSKGSMYISKDEVRKEGIYKVKTVDTTGAGDCFSAGFVYGIANGKSIRQAHTIASKCGAIAVTKKGARGSLPTVEAIENFEKFMEDNS